MADMLVDIPAGRVGSAGKCSGQETGEMKQKEQMASKPFRLFLPAAHTIGMKPGEARAETAPVARIDFGEASLRNGSVIDLVVAACPGGYAAIRNLCAPCERQQNVPECAGGLRLGGCRGAAQGLENLLDLCQSVKPTAHTTTPSTRLPTRQLPRLLLHNYPSTPRDNKGILNQTACFNIASRTLQINGGPGWPSPANYCGIEHAERATNTPLGR
ncbi:MAG: hypothetical protein M1829_005394 [Trizodia sp. TS-e1964]|nr:MAG: hypothetical protein M1829_005394 [Trizodia sp. TS-e1964]